jgi:hypothetical protein
VSGRALILVSNNPYSTFRKYQCYSRFHIFTVAGMKVTSVWVRAPCSLVEVDHCFRRDYCLHNRGDDRGSTHIWNVGLHGSMSRKVVIFKKILLPCTIADFLRAFVAVTTKVNYLDLIFQHFIPDGNILMLCFLLMYLKITLVVLPYLILFAYVYPLGELETSYICG